MLRLWQPARPRVEPPPCEGLRPLHRAACGRRLQPRALPEQHTSLHSVPLPQAQASEAGCRGLRRGRRGLRRVLAVPAKPLLPSRRAHRHQPDTGDPQAPLQQPRRGAYRRRGGPRSGEPGL